MAGGDRAKQIDSLQSVADRTKEMGMVLLVRETTQDGFRVQAPELRPNEYADFAASSLTLRQIYQIRPAFITRTLLPRPVARH